MGTLLIAKSHHEREIRSQDQYMEWSECMELSRRMHKCLQSALGLRSWNPNQAAF